MDLKYNHKYDDIINMEPHKSKKHPPMSLYARSSQFAAFAALVGYEDLVLETARETGEKIELDEELKKILDAKIQLLSEKIKLKPEVVFTYFIPDASKNGGKYVNVTGVVKKVDTYKQIIVLENKEEIPINEIIDVSGDIFKIFE